jgi:hypothetical protein
MSEPTYDFCTEIAGHAVRIYYRAPESGIEPLRIRCGVECSARGLMIKKCVEIHEACEADWRDRVEAQIDEEADRKLEERRDEELA